MDKRKVGSILIWLGILSWVPYIILLSLNRDVSVLPFLAAHLTGVLGGNKIRSNTEKQAEDNLSEPLKRRKKLSTILIYLGVAVWLPYIYLSSILQIETEIAPFLALHLTGVLGGAGLRISIGLSSKSDDQTE